MVFFLSYNIQLQAGNTPLYISGRKQASLCIPYVISSIPHSSVFSKWVFYPTGLRITPAIYGIMRASGKRSAWAGTGRKDESVTSKSDVLINQLKKAICLFSSLPKPCFLFLFLVNKSIYMLKIHLFQYFFLTIQNNNNKLMCVIFQLFY